MTPVDLAAAFAALRPYGYSYQRVAQLCGYKSHNSVLNMLEGRRSVDQQLAEWLARCAAWHAENPPPNRRENGR